MTCRTRKATVLFCSHLWNHILVILIVSTMFAFIPYNIINHVWWGLHHSCRKLSSVRYVYYLFTYVSEIEIWYTMMIWTYHHICLYPVMPLPLCTATQAQCSPVSSLRIYDKHSPSQGKNNIMVCFSLSVCVFKGDSREKVKINWMM